MKDLWRGFVRLRTGRMQPLSTLHRRAQEGGLGWARRAQAPGRWGPLRVPRGLKGNTHPNAHARMCEAVPLFWYRALRRPFERYAGGAGATAPEGSREDVSPPETLPGRNGAERER